MQKLPQELEKAFEKEIEHPLLLSENLGAHVPKKILDFLLTVYQAGRKDAVEYIREHAKEVISNEIKNGEVTFTIEEGLHVSSIVLKEALTSDSKGEIN